MDDASPPATPPAPKDPVVELLTELRDETRRLHAFHTAPKPWHAREPFRTMLSHAVTVTVALTIAYAVHALTGAPVPAIEAVTEKPGHSETVGTAPPPPAITAIPSLDVPAEYAYVQPPPSSTPPVPMPSVTAKARRPIPQAVAAAAAPPPPAATAIPIPYHLEEPMRTASPPPAAAAPVNVNAATK